MILTASTPTMDDVADKNDIAIRVSNLSKCYHIYDNPRDRLKQLVIPKLCQAIPALNKLFRTPYSLLPTSQGIPTTHSPRCHGSPIAPALLDEAKLAIYTSEHDLPAWKFVFTGIGYAMLA